MVTSTARKAKFADGSLQLSDWSEDNTPELLRIGRHRRGSARLRAIPGRLPTPRAPSRPRRTRHGRGNGDVVSPTRMLAMLAGYGCARTRERVDGVAGGPAERGRVSPVDLGCDAGRDPNEPCRHRWTGHPVGSAGDARRCGSPLLPGPSRRVADGESQARRRGGDSAASAISAPSLPNSKQW